LARGLVGNLGGPEKDFSAFGSSTVSGPNAAELVSVA